LNSRPSSSQKVSAGGTPHFPLGADLRKRPKLSANVADGAVEEPHCHDCPANQECYNRQGQETVFLSPRTIDSADPDFSMMGHDFDASDSKRWDTIGTSLIQKQIG
jgi:hypothetical protein